MPIKAVIFDLDGTVATFNLDYKTARSEVRGYLMKIGVPGSVITVQETIFGMLEKAELLMANAGKSPSLVSEIRKEALRIAEKFELEAAAQTSLLPGALDTLKELKRMQLKVALCTINGVNSTANILNRFKLGEYFDTVISRDQVVKVKPNPDHCNAALKSMNVAAAETVIIGDSAIDMQAAGQTGAIAVGLPTGVSTQEKLMREGANYIITSITDLPNLINCINKNETTGV